MADAITGYALLLMAFAQVIAIGASCQKSISTLSGTRDITIAIVAALFVHLTFMLLYAYAGARLVFK